MDLNSANLELKKKINVYRLSCIRPHKKGTWESLALCLELRKLHTDENTGIHNLMNTLILIKIEVSFGFKIVIK